MKYRHLVLQNLLRRKVRTGLTMGSFAVALFLFGILAVVRGAFQQGVEVAGADRLVVVNKVSIIQPLPLSYRDRLARLPGVTQVTFANWFGGVYQDERNFFPQFAIDRDTYRQMFPEFIVPEDQWQAFLADREGCIVGEALAERFRWKVGDRIPLKGTFFSGLWEFNIRGVYRGSRPQDDTTQFWLRWDYLDERRSLGKGFVGWYTVRIADPDDAVRVIGAIDQAFSNYRAGVRSFLGETDGQYRVPTAEHRRRGVLHPLAGEREHDGHRRARTSPGISRHESGRIFKRLGAGGDPRRDDGHGCFWGGCRAGPGETVHAPR
jgi:putative ABC transport system permease protein